MTNILVTEPEYFAGKAMKILKSAGKVTAVRVNRKRLEKIIGNFDVIVVRIETHLDKELLSMAKKLKLIGSTTTGLDHIDAEYAKAHGIEIVYLHGEHTTPTAEHTFALILSLSRKIPWAYDSLRQANWKRYNFIGIQLEGRVLGVIGFGRIGIRVSEYAKAFGMRVIAFDPYAKPGPVKLVSLPELLKKADIVTVHAVLTKQTRKMISYRQFGMMKRNALVINTARADIVDNKALLQALSKGIIYGAALDVFHREPLEDKTDPIIKYAKANHNLIITPHIGASTYDAVEKAGVEIATEIKKIVENDRFNRT